MDGLRLLHEARLTDLTVSTDGQRLTMRGPARLAPVAQQLVGQKQAVMDAWELYEERLSIILDSEELSHDEAVALAWMCLGYPAVSQGQQQEVAA